jgi:hypothetical protein
MAKKSPEAVTTSGLAARSVRRAAYFTVRVFQPTFTCLLPAAS